MDFRLTQDLKLRVNFGIVSLLENLPKKIFVHSNNYQGYGRAWWIKGDDMFISDLNFGQTWVCQEKLLSIIPSFQLFDQLLLMLFLITHKPDNVRILKRVSQIILK